MTCHPDCRYHAERATPAPPEPPVGTWVRDRFGATHYRKADGWAPAPDGFYAFGIWAAMWEARGPLEECGPWSASLTDSNPELWR